MRIRSIRPEFWSSEDVAAMDWHTRLVFIGLWSYVDDNGVGRDNERLIVADLFPLDADPRESLARVSRALLGLSEGGQIVRYEVDGKRYLHIVKWLTHQRVDKRGKDRYPLPTCDDAIIRESVATVSGDTRESVAPGEGERGRRGEGEKTPAPAPATPARASDFDEFWKLYPKKVEKVDARRKFAKAVKEVGLDVVMAGVRRLASDPNLPDKQYIPNPAKWLGNGGWDDEPYPPRLDRPGGRPAHESLADRLPMVGGGL